MNIEDDTCLRIYTQINSVGGEIFSNFKFCLLFSINAVDTRKAIINKVRYKKKKKLVYKKALSPPPFFSNSLRSNAALQKLSKTSHVNNRLAWMDLWRKSFVTVQYL
jgi:hypothetical protein